MFLVPDVIWEHYSNEFFYTQKKTQLAFREYLAVQIKNAIGTILPGGVWGGGNPPNVSTPFLPGRGGGGGGGGGGAKKLLRFG